MRGERGDLPPEPSQHPEGEPLPTSLLAFTLLVLCLGSSVWVFAIIGVYYLWAGCGR